MKKERVCVFIDGDNLYKLQEEHLGWRIDMKKFISFLSQFGQLIEANYYLSYIEDESSLAKRGFLHILHMAGYRVVNDTPKQIEGENGEIYLKACTDMIMAVDIMNSLDNFDMAIVVTGDSDFVSVLKALRGRGKRFLLISTHACIARNLRQEAARNYIDFSDIREQIERDLAHGNGGLDIVNEDTSVY